MVLRRLMARVKENDTHENREQLQQAIARLKYLTTTTPSTPRTATSPHRDNVLTPILEDRSVYVDNMTLPPMLAAGFASEECPSDPGALSPEKQSISRKRNPNTNGTDPGFKVHQHAPPTPEWGCAETLFSHIREERRPTESPESGNTPGRSLITTPSTFLHQEVISDGGSSSSSCTVNADSTFGRVLINATVSKGTRGSSSTPQRTVEDRYGMKNSQKQRTQNQTPKRMERPASSIQREPPQHIRTKPAPEALTLYQSSAAMPSFLKNITKAREVEAGFVMVPLTVAPAVSGDELAEPGGWDEERVVISGRAGPKRPGVMECFVCRCDGSEGRLFAKRWFDVGASWLTFARGADGGGVEQVVLSSLLGLSQVRQDPKQLHIHTTDARYNVVAGDGDLASQWVSYLVKTLPHIEAAVIKALP